MSDLAAGIPIGMSIGIGAGIAIGKKSGQKEVGEKIKQLSTNHEIRVKKPDGNYMSLEEFINEIAIFDVSENEKKKMNIMILVGVIILLIGILTFFLVN
ncbi:MAG: hypothetical protein D8M58_04190 [Calditrichaeota bacterium]|nr:MAG: hypothetical protein DWQ03_02885 [Calditrichota bacterium]MBL1204569.1 hypothetical protein [Calditrichota bacterium]NOG44398.1 hypothetical protein [Calditrichota bacterium]